MKITRTNLATIITEAIQNALTASSGHDLTDTVRETSKEKKARRDGKKQAVEKLADKTPEQLQQAYLKLEHQAETSYQDSLKHAFLWGALDQIKLMLNRAGVSLPKKSQDPWSR